MHRSSNRRAIAASLVLLLAPVAACSDDDEPEASSAFCDDVADFADALASGGDPSGPLDDLVASSPDSLASAVETFAQSVTEIASEAAESGDDAAFLEPGFRTLAAETQGEIARACDYAAVSVDATEYAFEGLPSTIGAGRVAFELTGAGDELHELIVFRRADGTEGDLVDIVNDDPNVQDGRLEEVAVALPVAAGDESVLLADLDPGDYVVVCFFPQGVVTFDELLSGTESDADHRSLGMIQALSVE